MKKKYLKIAKYCIWVNFSSLHVTERCVKICSENSTCCDIFCQRCDITTQKTRRSEYLIYSGPNLPIKSSVVYFKMFVTRLLLFAKVHFSCQKTFLLLYITYKLILLDLNLHFLPMQTCRSTGSFVYVSMYFLHLQRHCSCFYKCWCICMYCFG